MNAGRKSKYFTHVKPRLETVRALKRKGIDDRVIAEKLKISHESFYKYRREHAEFSDALKEGLDDSIAAVENAHFKSALGYAYDETEVLLEPTKKIDELGRPVMKQKIRKTTKRVQGNVIAQIHYLERRDPEHWPHKQTLELVGKDGNDLIFNVTHKPVE